MVKLSPDWWMQRCCSLMHIFAFFETFFKFPGNKLLPCLTRTDKAFAIFLRIDIFRYQQSIYSCNEGRRLVNKMQICLFVSTSSHLQMHTHTHTDTHRHTQTNTHKKHVLTHTNTHTHTHTHKHKHTPTNTCSHTTHFYLVSFWGNKTLL